MRQFKTIVISGLLATMVQVAVWMPRAQASSPASDNATNDNMTVGANGGTGFAAWSNIQTNSGGNFFTGSSTANSHHIAPGIDVAGKSWGMFASGTAVGTNYARMNRQFTAGSTPNVSLQPGQTFTVDMDNGLINTSGIIGFSLQNSSTNDVFSFKFIGGGSSYQINGATPANLIGYTNAGLRVAVTLTSSTAYSCSVKRPNTGTAITNTGNLMNPTGGQSIDRVIFFTNGTGSGSDYDLFFNSLSISCPDPPTVTVSPTNPVVCIGGIAVFSAATTGDGVTYQWQKEGVTISDGGTILGATTSILTLTGVSSSDSGSNFECVVTDACASTQTSAPAVLTVTGEALQITNQPAAQSVCSNATAVFTAGATGSPTYLWRKRGAGWGMGNGWQLTNSGASADGAFYVGTSAVNGNGGNVGIDSARVSWGMTADTGVELQAFRPLGTALVVGENFKIDIDTGFINAGLANNGTSNSVGFALIDTTGAQRLNFHFEGGRTDYVINDSILNRDTGVGFTAEGLHVAFTLTSINTYSLTISGVSGEPPAAPVTITGTLGGTSGASINEFKMYNNNAGAGTSNNQYWNNVSVDCEDDNAANYATSAAWTNGSNLGQSPLTNGTTGTGSVISGANTSSLTVSNVGMADVASYDVCVTNSCGIAISTPGALSIAQCGAYVSVSNTVGSSVIEARVYQNSGYVTLIGPDLDGNPSAVMLTFPPGSVSSGGNNYQIGPVLSSTTLSNGVQVVQSLGPTSIVVQVTFPYPGVMHYEVVNWGALPLTATCLTVPSTSSEHFYGFGEKFDAIDQAGNKVHIMTYDTSARTNADNTYAVAPWFMSTLGYGFDLDSTDESWFDMRNEYPNQYVISNMVGSSFSGYVTNALKYNVVYGPNLTDVLTRYTGYKGRPLLPPPWAFLPWMSSDVWSSGGEVRYVLSELRARGVPGSILVYDSPWEYSYNDFTWNTSQFSNSGTFENQLWPGFSTTSDMMTFLQTNGYKAVLWFTPFINTSSMNGTECYANCEYNVCMNENFGVASNYPAALASNLFVHSISGGVTNVLSATWWKGTGSPLDFTNPNAVQYLQSTLSNLITQSGGVIGGFKTDDGEAQAANVPNGPYIPTNALYADGRTGVEMQNGYSLEYQKTVSGVLGTNGIIWARSGFAGSQAYPANWGGDNQPNFSDFDGLPAVMLAGESCAMSGYSIWGSDICGYEDGPWSTTPTNLFMRWTQFGAFCPIMQMHRSTGLCWIYPWSFGADALTNYQYYAQLHTALFPYIYSYATQATTNGLPIIRPLVLMYQTDTNTYGSAYNTSHSYLFGNEFLVAPVVTNPPASGPTIRSVYLPQGNWYDYFANVRYSGGQTIVWTNANQHQMPLFVHEGAVIPMISTNVQTLLDTSYTSNPNLVLPGAGLQFLIYPTTNSSFTVYDGTSLTCQSNGTVIAATLNSNPRPISMRFFVSQPFGVEYNGIRMTQFSNSTDYATTSMGWYYDSSGFLNVTLNHTGGTAQITFGPDSIGDGISDSWRQDHFGSATTANATSCATCDADGTGQDNLFKYLAGLDPLNAASFLGVNSITIPSNGFGFGFASVLGMRYEVDYTPDIVNVPWQSLTNGIAGTGGTIPIVDPTAAGQTQRFYRVKLLPQSQ